MEGRLVAVNRSLKQKLHIDVRFGGPQPLDCGQCNTVNVASLSIRVDGKISSHSIGVRVAEADLPRFVGAAVSTGTTLDEIRLSTEEPPDCRKIGEFVNEGRVFFSSDLHFGHANILRFGRDAVFPDLNSMNEGLIARWNEVVGPEDTVFVLGDVAMGHRIETLPLAGRLNGTKHLIAGNHDNCWEHSKNPAKWIDTYLDFFATIQTEATFDTGAGVVRLHHFPYSGDHTEDDRYPHARPVDDGMPLLHGHMHDRWRFMLSAKNTPQVNVGVDVWDFMPVHLDALLPVLGLA